MENKDDNLELEFKRRRGLVKDIEDNSDISTINSSMDRIQICHSVLESDGRKKLMNP